MLKSQYQQQQEPEHLTAAIMKPRLLQKRLCDYCNDATALLYCRADSAKLCFSCDHEVHSTNQLFSKHTRSLLCDACDASPVSLFCETEHSVFCQNCDWERHSHSSLSSTHIRRPIEGFDGCPSGNDLMTILGLEDLGLKKSLFFSEESDGFTGSELDDVYSDLFVWDSPSVCIDDLIVSSDSGSSFQALEVPPLPKNRNAACGQHKEEILCQLRELVSMKPDPYGNADIDPVNIYLSLDADPQPPNLKTIGDPGAFASYEENLPVWLADYGEAANHVFSSSTLPRSNFEESCAVPDKELNIIGSTSHIHDDHEAMPQPLTIETLPALPNAVAHDMNSQERDSAVSRYKEKKKTRRYNKRIRYESRKLRAESRTRIRGRFAKMDR
ncbi:ZINC FINGER PROTEIN CONSTANS-LIKE 10 [Salix koriyanagi]|uniref:ZINC FINGER PROTEIN CONSTANS-LIKE 10 n=1 Tax=Salix koriyanagi TaxID=2511006 RepID=A0A9Q0TF21_9ROSI|nr:ZINC FINGER PROTEIN CONSTANS-LIKE 10 [Salix koriyanagi]